VSADPLGELEPRIRRMCELILANRAAICDPRTGVLELHFKGGDVSAHLRGNLTLRNEEREPPGAA
jgi:hypothetical protein